MNTSKSPRPRYSSKKPPKFPKKMPDPGIFNSGVKDIEIVTLIGQMAIKWPHVEEQMAEMLRWLLGGNRNMPAREIFRSIVSQEARIKMMKVLLEDSKINDEKPEFFDRAIDAFKSLNTSRNEYVHGLWFHDEKFTYLANARPGSHAFDAGVRVVNANEITQVISRMDRLVSALIAFYFYTELPPHPSEEYRNHLKRQIEGEL